MGVPNEFVLQVTPPRVPRHLIARTELAAAVPDLPDRPVIAIQAPAGFGKTSLLAQWRLEHLSRGTAVAWLSAQPEDGPLRFVHGLCHAVRVGAGRPTFAHMLVDAATPPGLEAITIWLAELAQSALDVVLVLDEADRLPAASRELLAYLLHNLPTNMRCVLAARTDCDLGLQDLAAYGHCTVLGAAHLRFSLAETMQMVRGRSGDSFDRDAAARLHEFAEGWPLGVQMALAVMDNSGGLARLDLPGGGLREQFASFLLRNLEPRDVDFLARISVVDALHPELAAALTGDAEAPGHLARLVRDTPVFTAGERTDWLRMHALAREGLRPRVESLPAGDRARLHAAAAAWLAGQGLVDAAAHHALAAGERDHAYALVESSLYDALMTQGHQAAVFDWLERMPAEELDRRPRFRLAAAWSLAGSQRHAEAEQLVARILGQPAVDDELRFECALILGSAANFADDSDRFAALHDEWGEHPPTANPRLLQVHANRSAFRALLDGEPALARLRQQHAPRGTAGYLDHWGDLIVALSYLWQGQVRLADSLLRPALAAAEADLGRRAPFASMLASLLAAAVWERDLPEEAAALLANRLDVIERTALPECVMLAYRTLARMAASSGADHRAAEMLSALDAVGMARELPRLQVVSLAEQVRMHARRDRAVLCRDLVLRLDEFLLQPGLPQGPLWQRSVKLQQALAHGYAHVAAGEWRRALEALAQADAIADRLRLGRLRIELLGLRAFALDRCGERSQPLLQEALGIAGALGLQRVFGDAHPALAEWVAQAGRERPAARPQPPATSSPPSPAAFRVAPATALTPKEREVLQLLARNLSNKEIGLALQVGEETIKWHIKNLFAKLDAGTRKQVVARARILGLLVGEA